jgi:hypothetical protein
VPVEIGGDLLKTIAVIDIPSHDAESFYGAVASNPAKFTRSIHIRHMRQEQQKQKNALHRSMMLPTPYWLL